MRSLDEYIAAINGLAEKAIDSWKSLHELLDEQMLAGDSEINEMVDFRVGHLTQSEIDRWTPYLISGVFEDTTSERRLAKFSLCADVQREVDELAVRRRCEAYDLSQPLFEIEELFQHVRKSELVSYAPLKRMRGSSVVEYASKFGRLDNALQPQLLDSLEAAVATDGGELHVRLDPYYCSDESVEPIQEAIIRPADRDWLPKLQLYKPTGSEYRLLSAESDTRRRWEYVAKRCRRLEVSANRSSGLLSMMIEEIVAPEDGANIAVCRCLHLDTFAEPGTPFREARLEHIDGAINVYFGDAYEERNHSRLHKGKVTDATIRVHVFRADGIPMGHLFEVARLFFRSQSLVEEWVGDQFRNPPE